jgi:hypothetical protein
MRGDLLGHLEDQIVQIVGLDGQIPPTEVVEDGPHHPAQLWGEVVAQGEQVRRITRGQPRHDAHQQRPFRRFHPGSRPFPRRPRRGLDHRRGQSADRV